MDFLDVVNRKRVEEAIPELATRQRACAPDAQASYSASAYCLPLIAYRLSLLLHIVEIDLDVLQFFLHVVHGFLQLRTIGPYAV